MNILKVLTAEEASALADLNDLKVSHSQMKELSDRLYRLAKSGHRECNISNMPEGYLTLLRQLGYDVNRITDNLIKIMW